MKSFSQDAEFVASLWRGLRAEQSLFLSIYLEDEFCGYCGIKLIDTRTPEIAIELLKKYHGQGIGYDALTALMNGYVKCVDVDYFLSRVV